MFDAFFMQPFTKHGPMTINLMRMIGANRPLVEGLRKFLVYQEMLEDRLNVIYESIPGFPAYLLGQSKDYVVWHKALHRKLLEMLDDGYVAK